MATTRLTKAEQSAQTRLALLDAAFAEDGYAATSTLARRAGVTRGALYYPTKPRSSRRSMKSRDRGRPQASRPLTETRGSGSW